MHVNLLSSGRVISARDAHTRDLGMPSLSQHARTRREMWRARFILFWRVSRECLLGCTIAMEIGFSQARWVGEAKEGRCDDNCVFNGASYTLASHKYVTPENELGRFYKDRHKKHISLIYFSSISSIKNNWYTAHFPDHAFHEFTLLPILH